MKDKFVDNFILGLNYSVLIHGSKGRKCKINFLIRSVLHGSKERKLQTKNDYRIAAFFKIILGLRGSEVRIWLKLIINFFGQIIESKFPLVGHMEWA